VPDQTSNNQVPSINPPTDLGIPPQPTTTPLKPKTGLVVGLILLFLSAIGAAGYFGYQYWQLRQAQLETTEVPIENSQPELAEDPTADWLTYTSEKYGYEIKYPKEASIYTTTKELFGIPTDKDGVPLDNELKQFNTFDQKIEYLYQKYGEDICLIIHYKGGRVVISSPANNNPRYVICGSTGIGVDTVEVEQEIVVDGKKYLASGRKADISTETPHEFFVIHLEGGTKIEFGSNFDSNYTFNEYLSVKDELIKILKTYKNQINNKEVFVSAVSNYLQALIDQDENTAKSYLTQPVQDSGEVPFGGWVSMYTNYKTYETLNEFHSNQEEQDFYNQDKINLTIKMYSGNDPRGEKAEMLWVKENGQWKTLTWYLFP